MDNPFTQIRELANLSVLQWCHEINLSPQAVYRIEDGAGASKKTCLRIAEKFAGEMDHLSLKLEDLLLWPMVASKGYEDLPVGGRG